MTPEQINTITTTVANLVEMGIRPVTTPTEFKAYYGCTGSIANNKSITLGRIKEMRNPLGEPSLGVFVRYEAESESGEDYCDYTIKETRNVPLTELTEYLRQRGFYVRKK